MSSNQYCCIHRHGLPLSRGFHLDLEFLLQRIKELLGHVSDNLCLCPDLQGKSQRFYPALKEFYWAQNVRTVIHFLPCNFHVMRTRERWNFLVGSKYWVLQMSLSVRCFLKPSRYPCGVLPQATHQFPTRPGVWVCTSSGRVNPQSGLATVRGTQDQADPPPSTTVSSAFYFSPRWGPPETTMTSPEAFSPIIRA